MCKWVSFSFTCSFCFWSFSLLAVLFSNVGRVKPAILCQQFFKRIRFFARSLSCTKIKLAIVRKYYLYFCIWNDVCACERSSNYIIAHTQFDVLFTLYRIDGSLFHYRTLYLMEMKKTPNINHNSTTIGPKQYAQRIIFRHIFCC